MSEAWDPQLRLLCALLPFQAQVAWKRQVGGSIEASPSTLKSYLCPIGSTHGARDRSRDGVSAHNPAPHSSPHPHRSTGLGLLCGHFACCPATEDPDEPQTLKPLNPAKHAPSRPVESCWLFSPPLLLPQHDPSSATLHIFPVTAGGNSCR